jgi:hypothetical protein
MEGSIAGQLLDWDTFPFQAAGGAAIRRFPGLLEQQWEAICRDAASSGHLKELHAARGDLLTVFDQLLAFHKNYLGLLDLQERCTGRDTHRRERRRFLLPSGGPERELTLSVAHPRELREDVMKALDELTQLRDAIFSHWHTMDDLAKILIETFSLPANKLRELAIDHAPPASWAEETDDPFSAD